MAGPLLLYSVVSGGGLSATAVKKRAGRGCREVKGGERGGAGGIFVDREDTSKVRCTCFKLRYLV